MHLYERVTQSERRPVTVSYEDHEVDVRGDLAGAHARVWEHVGRPGAWWTGAERVAIAAETRNARNCKLCGKRREALSPNSVDGAHDGLSELDEAAVDAIHRIVNDPSRLSETTYQRLLADGLTEGAYVELVAVVVFTCSIDMFAHALGARMLPLPHPEQGKPTRYRPRAARKNGAWVPTIACGDEAGSESDLYGGRPRPSIATSLSLVPEEVRTMMMLGAKMYLGGKNMMNLEVGRALSRPQMELIAARVSAHAECFY